MSSWDGTSAGWAAHLDELETSPASAGVSVKRLNEDLAPGFYVSAMRTSDKLKALVEGPYDRHEEALVRVWPVSRAWGDVDPLSCWYAWGTAKVNPKD